MAKPVKCEHCGRENDPTLSSCLDCGHPLGGPGQPHPAAPALAASPPSVSAPLACARCGALISPGYRFCGRCGTAVGATPSPDAAAAAGGGAAAGRGPRLNTVRTDGAPGTAFPLRSPSSVCGRLEGDIRFPDDATVSPRHASFTVQGDRVTVEDLGSLNGTFLRIRSPHQLAAGEEIRLGRQILRLEPMPHQSSDDAGYRSWGGADPGYRMRLAQLLEGGGVGEIHPLHEGENLIGRETGELVFPGDRYVSARHARVVVVGGAVTVTDLGSSNGTFRRISGPTAMAPGDQLLIGVQLLKLEA